MGSRMGSGFTSSYVCADENNERIVWKKQLFIDQLCKNTTVPDRECMQSLMVKYT
jgi:hypothetical protein